MCLAVRDDIPQGSPGSPIFSRKHPLSLWMSSMLLCFGGSFLANLLLGEPLIVPLKDHRAILTATAVWYLINYSPFDVVYRLIKFLPCKMVVCSLKEVQRAHKVYHAVIHTMKIYPSSYLVVILIGTVKGAGSGFMKNFERLIRGLWIPGSNELLQPSFTTKAVIVAALVFLLEKLNYITAPHPLVYFGVVIFFVYFKLSALLLGIHDPFAPFENLFCAVFMGGMWDAMRRAVTKAETKEETDVPVKSKEDKKND